MYILTSINDSVRFEKTTTIESTQRTRPIERPHTAVVTAQDAASGHVDISAVMSANVYVHSLPDAHLHNNCRYGCRVGRDGSLFGTIAAGQFRPPTAQLFSSRRGQREDRGRIQNTPPRWSDDVQTVGSSWLF